MHDLDIIVTHYKEPSSIVKRFLDSLKEQTYESIKVTIVDDGFDCPDLKLDESVYSFEVVHLRKEHKTVSSARNFGMDNTRAPYLMFCDCDDMFDDRNRNGLRNAMMRIKMNDLCVYRSCYSFEAWKDDSKQKALSALYKSDESDVLVLLPSKINSSVIHSKIYQRKFVEDNDIRFLEDLWMNEDGAFNNTAKDICMTLNLRSFDDCERFYIWKYNEFSVTRTNGMYPVKGYDQYIKAISYYYKKVSSVCNVEIDSKSISQFIFQAYFWLHLYSDRFIGMEGFKDYMSVDLKEVRKFLEEYMLNLPENIFEIKEMNDYQKNFMKKLENRDVSGKMSLKQWISYVMENNQLLI